MRSVTRGPTSFPSSLHTLLQRQVSHFNIHLSDIRFLTFWTNKWQLFFSKATSVVGRGPFILNLDLSLDTVPKYLNLSPYWQAPRWGGSVTRCPSTRRWSGESDPWTGPRRTGGVEKEVCGCLSSLSLTAASTPARPPTPSAASAGVSTSPSWYDTAWFSVLTTYVRCWLLYQCTAKKPFIKLCFWCQFSTNGDWI